MPIIASAKKRMRQTRTRTLRNRVRKERLKKALKGFHATLRGQDAAAIATGLRQISKCVDKACTKGVLHKNTANRKKSRLAKAAHRAAAAKA